MNAIGLDPRIPAWLTGYPVVYHLISADSRCLYVGMTRNLPQRVHHHRAVKHWFGDVARVAVCLHPGVSIKELHAIEVEEIQRCRPVHNRDHNWSHFVDYARRRTA